LVIDLRAREFLRNMVRRIVASMIKVGEGKATLEDVREALEGDGRRDISFGLAAPEGLTLMDIDYGFCFDVQCPQTMRRRAEESRREALARLLFADALLDRCHQ
jgi:tRNA pseudouridine38-40 synthase